MRKCINFILVEKILGQNSNKKMFRKNFLTFCMFFKFKRSILRGVFSLGFSLFLFFFKQRYKIGDEFLRLVHTVALFHKRAILLHLFTKGVYCCAFSRKSCTVAHFTKGLITPLSNISVMLMIFAIPLHICLNSVRGVP